MRIADRLLVIGAEMSVRPGSRVCGKEIVMAGFTEDRPQQQLLVRRIVNDQDAHAATSSRVMACERMTDMVMGMGNGEYCVERFLSIFSRRIGIGRITV
jgi:hypothetical protein